MKNICIILFIFASITLVAFVPSTDSLLKKSNKNPVKIDTNHNLLTESWTKTLKLKSSNPELSSNMPVKKPKGKHFMQIAVPDSSIHYHLLIKGESQKQILPKLEKLK